MNNDIKTSIVRNTTVMMVSQVITWISSFILMLFLPRYLGDEDFGRLFLAMSLAMVLQVVVEFGGPNLIAKELARSRGKIGYLLSNSLMLRAILWVVSIIVLAVVGYAVGYPKQVQFLMLVLGISKLWESAGKVLASCFQGFESMQYSMVGAVAERVFLTVCAVIVLLLGASSLHIGIIMGLSTLLNFLVSAKLMRRFTDRLDRVRWETIVSLAKSGMPYFLMSVFAVAYFRVDAVMLSLMVPTAAVGWYGAAHRLFDGLMFLPNIYTTAVFPVFSRLSVNDSQSLAETTHKSLEFILMAGIPLSIIVFGGAKEIIDFFFGLKGYLPSVLILQVFSVGMILVYIDFVLVSALIACDRQREWTAVAFLAMLTNPLLNYFLIPYTHFHFANGGIGAALATVVTEFLVMCALVFLIPKGIFNSGRAERFIKCLFCGGSMIGCFWLLNQFHLPVPLTIVVATMVYALALLYMRILSWSQIYALTRYVSLKNVHELLVVDRRVSA